MRGTCSFRLAQRDEHARVQVKTGRPLEPAVPAEVAQESRHTVRRLSRVAALESDLSQPELRVGVELDLTVQLGRLLEPSLAPPQVSATDQRLKRDPGPTGSKLAKRCLECGVSLFPGSPQDENRPVVRPAYGEQILDPPALGELQHSLRPLIGAL